MWGWRTHLSFSAINIARLVYPGGDLRSRGTVVWGAGLNIPCPLLLLLLIYNPSLFTAQNTANTLVNPPTNDMQQPPQLSSAKSTNQVGSEWRGMGSPRWAGGGVWGSVLTQALVRRRLVPGRDQAVFEELGEGWPFATIRSPQRSRSDAHHHPHAGIRCKTFVPTSFLLFCSTSW